MRGLETWVTLGLAVLVLAYAQGMFPTFGAEVEKASTGLPSDQRQLVAVTPEERLLLLHNMVAMLANLSDLLNGVASGNRKAILRAASANGTAMMKSLPGSLKRKFPRGFAQMAAATHRAFDQVATEAKTAKGKRPLLKSVSAAVQTCVACHMAYRFGSGR